MGFGSGGEGFVPGRNDVTGDFTVVGNVSASVNISGSSFYGDGSNLSNVGGGSLTITVGNSISNGTSARVLFENSSNELAQDASLTWDGTTFGTAAISGSTTLAVGGNAYLGSDVFITGSGHTLTIGSLTATDNLDIGAYDLRAATITADGLTSGRVVFAGTNGVLSDDSDFSFATDTLTVTKIGAFEAAGAINFSDEAMTNVNIDGGAIDGTPIGANAVSTGVFSTLQANSTLTVTNAGMLTVSGALQAADISGSTALEIGGDAYLGANVFVTGSGHTLTATTVDINGGAIDGAIIGANDAAAGTFAALTATAVSGSDTGLEALCTAGQLMVGGMATIAKNGNIITSGSVTLNGLTATSNLDIGAYDLRAATVTADGLTAGRVVFAGTDGVLSDDGDLTFSTDTLTATKIGAFEAAGAINFSDEAMTNVNIDSGVIDNTPIGNTTPAAVRGTVLSGSDTGLEALCTAGQLMIGGMATITKAGAIITSGSFNGTTISGSNVDDGLSTAGKLQVAGMASIDVAGNLITSGSITTTSATISTGLTMGDTADVAFNTGTGTKLGTATGQKIGFFNATPVIQQAGAGETTGYAAVGGTNVDSNDTFTGNVGSAAYTINDIVKALKNLGLLAS